MLPRKSQLQKATLGLGKCGYLYGAAAVAATHVWPWRNYKRVHEVEDVHDPHQHRAAKQRIIKGSDQLQLYFLEEKM